MNSQRPASQAIEPSLIPSVGWHCAHFYYQFDRRELAKMDPAKRASGCQQFCQILTDSDQRPERLQASIISGHRADFGLMIMDPDPLKIDAVHQRLLASDLGPALQPTYSFVSITEISEYVPSIADYSAKLLREGESESSPTFAAKVKAYEGRLPAMNRQRLTPEFPDWPASCFYPMNKVRHVGANWFMLPPSERQELMSEHARSGMQFMGRVSQLITVSLGFDDWEWGVTLWAANPEFLKDIVYKMRFDQASAKYAEFGSFYVGYIATPDRILEHCRVRCG
jgi:chlorite dismutase